MQEFFATVLARLAAELIERLLIRLGQVLFAKPAAVAPA
jgi:hypothetical protein